ncbi:MAG: hypothetical protein JW724_01040 [Candidatus Altiarchaeota archaeon]|nr:hypothetical protein [Candidatus Altiarchaeota archaeon]
MNLLSEITLKWYDDSSLLLDDRRELLELFLDSMGISRGIAADLFEVLLLTKSEGIALNSRQIRGRIVKLREKRKQDVDDALTLRNVQLWMKFFRTLGFVERIGDRYAFKGNKKPSRVFQDNVKPQVIDKSSDYLFRVLAKLEERYDINK